MKGNWVEVFLLDTLFLLQFFSFGHHAGTSVCHFLRCLVRARMRASFIRFSLLYFMNRIGQAAILAREGGFVDVELYTLWCGFGCGMIRLC
jgi:hypothetical protein